MMVSDFSSLFCSVTAPTAFTYTVTYSPTPPAGDIVFTQASRYLNWITVTEVNVYTVTVTGTLSAPDNRAFSGSFTLTINNACNAATVNNLPSVAITYTLGGVQ